MLLGHTGRCWDALGYTGTSLGDTGFAVGHPWEMLGYDGEALGHPWNIRGHAGTLLGCTVTLLGHWWVVRGHTGICWDVLGPPGTSKGVPGRTPAPSFHPPGLADRQEKALVEILAASVVQAAKGQPPVGRSLAKKVTGLGRGLGRGQGPPGPP